MLGSNWRDYEAVHKPLVDTGREPLPLEKYPKDLDFSTTIGGTTYMVNSRFSKNTKETLLDIIIRWFQNDTDISEQSL